MSEVERLVISIQIDCGGCPLFSGSDCMMPTPEFGCVRDMELQHDMMRDALVKIAEMKIPYCDSNHIANSMRNYAKDILMRWEQF